MSYQQKILLLFIVFGILISFSLELRDLRVVEEEEEEVEEEEEIEERSNVNPPKFSRISGFYPDEFKLKLFSEENYTIYYTVDSTDPRKSKTAKKFKDYILIYDKSSEPNLYAAIGQNDSSPVSVAIQYNYKVPFYPVDKAMVIRAVTKNSEGEFSEIVTKTYFVTNEGLYKYEDLTVISLVTSPENLFDPDFGIYVSGNQFQEAKKKAMEEGVQRFDARKAGSNFQMKGKEWERESFVTIFDKGDINLQQTVGLRIKGAYTRMYPCKSFNIYARKKYGKKNFETNLLTDNYDVNGDLITKYKSLSLRNIYDSGRLRDKFGRDLFYVREGLASPSMRNAVLFLNGEYWGFYLIQEKLDNVFISNNFAVKKKKITMGKANKFQDGNETEFLNFNYTCGNYSLKDVSDDKIYSKIKEFVDIDSFVELFANGLYIANSDWPGNNDGEWKYIGKPKEKNKYTDGKWRFFMYDLDYSMSSPNSNNFMNAERKGKYAYIRFFFTLVKNNIDFRNKFVNRICDCANGIYNRELVKELIEKYKDECTDYVANSQLRWSSKYYNSILEGIAFYRNSYYKALDSLYNFYDKRPEFIFQHVKNYLGLKGSPVNLTIEIEGKGKVQVSTIIPKFNSKTWTGQYFSRIPISIKAIPDVGYYFKEWDGDFHSDKQIDEITLLNSTKIIAIFE